MPAVTLSGGSKKNKNPAPGMGESRVKKERPAGVVTARLYIAPV
jgi:hypothetical protein